jgi:S1-C subfamily serine protease
MKTLQRVAILAFILCGLPAALASEPEDPPTVPGVIHLPELEVKTTAYCNFGFGIVVFGDVKAGTISRVLIDEVKPDSAASRMGLQRGDEILSVNGMRVADMKGGMKGGSDLFRLLINRPAGVRIDVEVEVRVVKRVTLIAGPSP